MDLDDRRHLEAAKGWIGLGNWSEANDELDRISPASRAGAEVLMMRARIYEKTQKLGHALSLARDMAHGDPIQTAYRLRVHHPAEARDMLLPVVDRFPDDWSMRYNLACCECKLGNLKAAFDWLEKAIDLSDCPEIRLMALGDYELEPLWADISEI